LNKNKKPKNEKRRYLFSAFFIGLKFGGKRLRNKLRVNA